MALVVAGVAVWAMATVAEVKAKTDSRNLITLRK
jgi:hypothetical protein